jgi:hypothetical protein
MSNTRYLEVDSTYRDRNRFPEPSNFEIPLSQTGRRTGKDCIDPVCKATPIVSWTSNNLSVNIGNVKKLICNVLPKTSDLSGCTNTQTFIINSVPRLHQLYGYYVGLIIEDSAFYNRRRITEYEFLGSYPGYDRAKITVDSSFPETFVPGNQINIYDPTDLSNSEYPFFWVPATLNKFPNRYVNYLLFNESLNDWKKILHFDEITHTFNLDTSDGLLPGEWNALQNYSIRVEPPIFPPRYMANPTILAATASTITVDMFIPDLDSSKFIRFVPSIYNYDPITSNQYRRVVSYDNVTNIINVFPNFDVIPSPGALIEVMNISHDNLNPFVYTGSLTSQQELVCYEIELLSLLMPTEILKSGIGGSISYYPYVYVELSNTCSQNRNIIYSNNPHSNKALFRVPVFDIQESPVFTKIGGGMSQTIKFKPNDTLSFSVRLPTGDLIKAESTDNFSPALPNPFIQFFAMFSLKRLV